jgi:phenylacetate-CoA ligase
MIYNIKDIINHARKNSPFYAKLYQDLPDNCRFDKLPIIDQKEFWGSNIFENNQLLTAKFTEGILFKSGGTSGNPKFSAFNKDEWNSFTTVFGTGISNGNLKDGDYVGNLFYAGDLYASFSFIMKSLENGPVQIVQFPMTGNMTNENIVKAILDYKINVLAGVPTTFVNLAEYIINQKIEIDLDLILFGGESLYNDQIKKIKKAFPSAAVNSIGIASVDGGHLGYFDESCKNGEHKVFKESTIIEVVDEDTNEVITENNKVGRLVYTNLTRKLMPIIRYPAGDRAEWLEVGSKYKLQGRSDEGARVGPVSIGTDDILNIFTSNELKSILSSFQLVIDHYHGLDILTINLVLEKDNEIAEEDLISILYRERPMFKKSVDDNIISKPRINIVKLDELIRNKKTGKQKLVVDLRSS